ncbi:MAG TPA: acyl carrier protein [Blastocatellia bacterium]|nr:acyl carrier protein [Blastocatellia bacterium]
MTKDQIEAIVLRTLRSIAPEADLSQIKPDVALRDQLDVDSMDFLNFMIGLHKELNVEIPEADYPQLATLNGCVAYLKRLEDKAERVGGNS